MAENYVQNFVFITLKKTTLYIQVKVVFCVFFEMIKKKKTLKYDQKYSE